MVTELEGYEEVDVLKGFYVEVEAELEVQVDAYTEAYVKDEAKEDEY